MQRTVGGAEHVQQALEAPQGGQRQSCHRRGLPTDVASKASQAQGTAARRQLQPGACMHGGQQRMRGSQRQQARWPRVALAELRPKVPPQLGSPG